MHLWVMESIICCGCGIVLENIMMYVDDKMTILVVIWVRYAIWNLVSHAR